ncbi:hypothetical protein GVO57_02080 [Sphingomonas changnyeongensis]|uniref:Uncharacterized protein n=2 Tax=Sphingomonas changnyeongensis TaxID=2698679 RepID=A0A7Z2S494_9SPHN|nr:hypothetical protein GVO57_02080 [Sphingomonas changnyeongensis]
MREDAANAAGRSGADRMSHAPGSDGSPRAAGFADVAIAIWFWPWLLAPAIAGAAQALFGLASHPAHHAQLPMPDTIAAHDDHGLFA